MRSFILAALLLGLAACEAPSADRFDLVIDDVAVLDTRDGALETGQAIGIRDGRIARIGAAGLSPLEALQAATLNPAQIFQTGHPGYLAENAPADIVLLDVNPLDDLEALGAPAGVMRAGEWFDAAALEAMREQARNWRPFEG